ncbi:MAG TPA: UDP-N-acetylmuramoyl-tripeptide--D-alanyl-D-alanine ligase [Thiothrix sp.]|nr:UDP-N-acetylmuramoyl-tripeptide--D-alanyl-D-alanine ligase [Thiothrix sp.]
MSWLTLTDIATITKGELYNVDVAIDVAINSVSIDSRKVLSDSLFIAIKGERFDAHDFVADLVDKAGAALVSQRIDCRLPQVIVKDTKQALADLAAGWRQQYSNPVIGLTGSNGKTTLKEMIAAILAQKGHVLATDGNFNNDIGMPLTLLRIREDHDYAVIEMGANHFNEIDFLTHIAKPTVAVINNAGPAHLEGFGDIEGVAKAKGEIFAGLDDTGVAIINADDVYATYWSSLNKQRQTITFGLTQPADISGRYIAGEKLRICCNAANTVNNNTKNMIDVALQLPGRHNAMNALAATAAVTALGVDLATVKQGLEALTSVSGRLAAIEVREGFYLIDDTYNANPASASAAIDVLATRSGVQILVLGDMGELGENAVMMHKAVGEQAKQAGIDYLFGLGAMSAEACAVFGQAENAYSELDALVVALQQLEQHITKEVTILVKGSRGMAMEKVVSALSANIKQGIH